MKPGCRLLEHFFACIGQMGGSYDHPSAVALKYRSHILGKESVLVGKGYNSERTCNDVGISEGSFHNLETCQSAVSDSQENSLEREISLCAMLFCTLNVEDTLTVGGENIGHPMDIVGCDSDLENVEETEGRVAVHVLLGIHGI